MIKKAIICPRSGEVNGNGDCPIWSLKDWKKEPCFQMKEGICNLGGNYQKCIARLIEIKSLKRLFE